MQPLSSSPKYTINTPQKIEIKAGTLQLKTNDTCTFTPLDGDSTQYTLDVNHRDSFRISKTTYDEIFRVQNFCTATVRCVLCPVSPNTPTSTITVEQLKTTILTCQSTFDLSRGHGKSIKKGKADTISKKLQKIVNDRSATIQTIRTSLQKLLDSEINFLIGHTSPDVKHSNPTKHSATCTLRASISKLLIDIDTQQTPFFTAVCSSHNSESSSCPAQHQKRMSSHEQFGAAADLPHLDRMGTHRPPMALPIQAAVAADPPHLDRMGTHRPPMALPIQAAVAADPLISTEWEHIVPQWHFQYKQQQLQQQ